MRHIFRQNVGAINGVVNGIILGLLRRCLIQIEICMELFFRMNHILQIVWEAFRGQSVQYYNSMRAGSQ